MNLTESPTFASYAVASTVLALHLIALALYTGTMRSRHKVFVNAEDATLLKGQHAELDHVDVLRAKRAHQNALENAVPFFAVGLLYVATGASKQGAEIYFGVFVAMRLLHSIFYLWGRQPFRTMTFGIGVLAIFGMALHVLRTAI
jgi:glutathione S-transferase